LATPGPAASVTFVYQGGSLLAAVPGVAKVWIDDGRLLVQAYSNAPSPPQQPAYAGTTLYDPQGNALSSPALPEIPSFTPLTANRLFVRSSPQPAIYDWTTGALVNSLPTAVASPSGATSGFVVTPMTSYIWGIGRIPY
jgi:hypothetical protein